MASATGGGARFVTEIVQVTVTGLVTIPTGAAYVSVICIDGGDRGVDGSPTSGGGGGAGGDCNYMLNMSKGSHTGVYVTVGQGGEVGDDSGDPTTAKWDSSGGTAITLPNNYVGGSPGSGYTGGAIRGGGGGGGGASCLDNGTEGQNATESSEGFGGYGGTWPGSWFARPDAGDGDGGKGAGNTASVVGAPFGGGGGGAQANGTGRDGGDGGAIIVFSAEPISLT